MTWDDFPFLVEVIGGVGVNPLQHKKRSVNHESNEIRRGAAPCDARL